MPSFNHEMFVAQAMKSVFEQSYQDVEFLIVDDCSTDATFEIIRRMAANQQFKRRFRRLHITRNHTNMGAHQALNSGIEAAAGQFITFINSDDGYEPERLRLLLSHHNSVDAPYLAFSAVKLIDGHGSPVKSHELKTLLEQGPQRLGSELPSMSFAFLGHQIAGSTGNIFVNRMLLEEIGGFLPLRYCHDWEFMLRAITITEPYYVPETSYKYRIHAANSFSILRNVADEDTAATLASYYQRIASGRVRNTKAPTPNNWPFVFDMVAREFGVYDAWIKESSYCPRYASRQALLLADTSRNVNRN